MDCQQLVLNYAVKSIFNKQLSVMETITKLSALIERFQKNPERLDLLDVQDCVLQYTMFYAYWFVKLQSCPNPFDHYDEFAKDVKCHTYVPLLREHIKLDKPDKVIIMLYGDELCGKDALSKLIYDAYGGVIINTSYSDMSAKKDLRKYVYDIQSAMYDDHNIIILNHTNHKMNIRKEIYRIANSYRIVILDFESDSKMMQPLTFDEKTDNTYMLVEHGIVSKLNLSQSNTISDHKQLKKYYNASYIGVEVLDSKTLLSHPIVEQVINEYKDMKIQDEFHVTIEYFGFKQDDLVKNKYNDVVNTKIDIICLGICADEYGIAVLVENNMNSRNDYAHITIGNKERTAVYSNELIKNTILTTCKMFETPLVLNGCIRMFK